MSRSKLTSPAKNLVASYELAAKDIEQEKRMVAALKRLSFGHLLNTDPDIPVPDAHYSFVVDNQYDAYSGSHSPSSRSSSASSVNGLPQKNSSQTELEFYDSESSFEPQTLESDAVQETPAPPSEEVYDEGVMWVPANLHPEINPQQFKNHVKTTIDELLERKISRSKSANRSKRSSLSFSTTDDVDDDEPEPEASFTSFNADTANPSLRELSSELQAMSRLAGMDSNDAVTLARSLSTSTIGYSDVEKLAFDKLNSNYPAPQAEMLDLGEDTHLHSPSQENTHPTNLPHKQSRALHQSRNESTVPSYRRPADDFALKRSRRLDYRKNPSSSLLGSQLQSGKADKLAELRHTLKNSLTTDFSNAKSSLPSPSSRNSVQSINPRNSQFLFSYKKLSPKSPVKPSPKSPDSFTMTDFGSKDSPYLTTLSTASIEQNIHPTKYGQRNLTLKNYGPVLQANSLHKHKSSREPRKPSSGPSSPHLTSGYHIPSPTGLRNSSREEVPLRSSSDRHAQKEHALRRGSSRDKSVSNHPQAYHSNEKPYGLNQHSYYKRDPNYGRFDENSLSGQPHLSKAKNYLSVRRVASADRLSPNNRAYPSGMTTLGSSHKYKEYRAREKTRELNQNLDLFRDELNEFKEKLTRNELHDPKHDKTLGTMSSNNKLQAEPDLSFDLTSHDVSYDDSLGIEKDVLGELQKETKQTDNNAFPIETENLSSSATEHRRPSIDEEIKNEPIGFSSQSRAVSDSQVPPGIYGTKQELAEAKLETPQIAEAENQELGLTEVTRETVCENEVEETEIAKLPENEHSEKAEDLASLLAAPAPKSEPGKKRGRKTWLWSKEKLQSKPSVQQTPVPYRSVSLPEIVSRKLTSSAKEDLNGKENVITKLFKKRRSSSASQDKNPHLSKQIAAETEEDQNTISREPSRSSIKLQQLRQSSSEEVVLESKPEPVEIIESKVEKSGDGSKTSRLKKKIKSMTKIHEEKKKSPEQSAESESLADDTPIEEEDDKPKSTLEVQERLKKSIRRTSKANQPIEFTDSAFGFPLPPPSTSTLVMIDYRFPVHVERAIYRLSHLKLANPKRSLREQVLLSNFMYAYLNLVDHTLHLEQQMSLEDYEIGQPEPDSNLLGDQDVDTDFEGDGELEGGDFETIKIDLDVSQPMP